MTLGDNNVESLSARRQAPSSDNPGPCCGAWPSSEDTISARSMFFRAVYKLSTKQQTHQNERQKEKITEKI